MFNFAGKIKEKLKPPTNRVDCDFCGVEVKRPVTAEVKTPPYTLNFCCYGCKIGYLALGENESSVSDLIIKDLKLPGREPIFKKPAEFLSFNGEEENCNTLSFGIKGVTCTSCIPVIEKTLELQENVVSAKVNPVSHIVTLNLEKEQSNIKSIKKVLQKLGYSISEYEGSYDNLKEESYSLLARFGFGVFMSMNIMVFSFLLYSKYFIKLRSQIVNYSHFILWFFATAIVAVVGFPIFKSAFKKLISLTYNSDTLISIGVLSAYVYSSLITFGIYDRSSGVFFDTAAIILILITFGKFLEASAKKSSLSGLHGLTLLRPDFATIAAADGSRTDVDIKAVKAGDMLSVKAGEIIPADGKLASEYAAVDESMYSGEPLSVNKKSGDGVLAGSVNRGGAEIVIEATSAVYKSYLFKMIRFAERSYNMKIEPLRYVDEIAGVFVPVIVGASLLTLAVYYFLTRDADLSVIRFISVLVVACPCAFGLAAPLVIANGISRAQKDKILINGAETFELMSKAGTVVFDKTGTLTEGLPSLKETVFAGTDDFETDAAISELIQVAGLIEKNISDRIAEAFRIKSGDVSKSGDYKKIEETDISDIAFKAGYGASARYYSGGDSNNGAYKNVVIGNEEFMDMNGVYLTEEISKRAFNYERNGDTIVYMGMDSGLKCFFVISDRIKAGAAEAVNGILSLGKKVIMLSGDSEPAVRFIASVVGIKKEDAHAGMKPEEKLEFVKNLKNDKKNGVVVFVGDGLNDIPAMEEADVSIVSPSRYELPFSRSNAVLLDGNLNSIAKLYKTALGAKKIIKENLLFSFAYNIVAIPLAVIGILNPLSAAVSMMASSIFITLNSLKIRMRRKEEAATGKRDEKIMRKTILNSLRG